MLHEVCILPRVAFVGTRNPRDRRVQRVRSYVDRYDMSELPVHSRGFKPPTTDPIVSVFSDP
jgi:hypothetical protein